MPKGLGGETSIKATFEQAYYCLLKQSLQLITTWGKKKKTISFILHGIERTITKSLALGLFCLFLSCLVFLL